MSRADRVVNVDINASLGTSVKIVIDNYESSRFGSQPIDLSLIPDDARQAIVTALGGEQA